MDVKKLFDRKEELEEDLYCIDRDIKERWGELTGIGCNNLQNWFYDEYEDVVSVGYIRYDNLPARFFREPDTDKAKKEYDIYFAEQKEKDKEEKARKKEEEEKELLRKLKEKYE